MYVLVWVCNCVSPLQYEFVLKGENVVELQWGHACTRACACMRADVFPFLSVKTQSYVCFTNVYEGICFLSVHFYEHARQLSQHTRAHTCRDHSHTLELWW